MHWWVRGAPRNDDADDPPSAAPRLHPQKRFEELPTLDKHYTNHEHTAA